MTILKFSIFYFSLTLVNYNSFRHICYFIFIF